ncbi:MAG: metallophosphoesterase [Candidatus Eisenbacteria bacterium]|nr:metallophosphoesterase [Candidatus Eisenbacteria bacterium]
MSLTLRSGRRGFSRALRFAGAFLQICLVLASLGGVAHAHAPRGEELARLDALLREHPQDVDLRLRRAGLRIEVGFLDGATSDLLWAGMGDPGRIEVPVGRLAVALGYGDPGRGVEALESYRAAHPERAGELQRRVLAVLDELELGGISSALTGDLRRAVGSWKCDAASEGSGAGLPGGGTDRARSAGPAALVIRGPYVMSTATSSTVVRWRTDLPTDSWVRYGVTPGDLSLTASDPTESTEHEITVMGLVANTRYYFSVGTSVEPLSGGDQFTYFQSAPVAQSAHTTRAWILGDSGGADYKARAVRNAFLQWNANAPIDFMLLLGDNAYDAGTDAQYQAALFDMYPSTLRSTTLWTTRGNHDVLYSGSGNDYYDLFTLPRQGQCGGQPSFSEAYYAYDWGNAHFVCLDSEGSSRAPGGSMATWLQQDLAQNERDWTICYWHHPPYTHGSHDSDDPTDSGGRMTEMRANILPILDSFGVDLVLCGHSHSYERSFLIDGHYGVSSTFEPSMIIDGGNGNPAVDGPYEKGPLGMNPHLGIVYGTMGSSSRLGDGTFDHPVMVTSQRRLGSELLEIDGDQLQMWFVDTLGVVRDRFAMVKHGASQAGGAPTEPAGPAGGEPNPFRQTTALRFELPSGGVARVRLLDSGGRVIRSLAAEVRAAGEWIVAWDGRDDAGRTTPPGVYFAVLETPELRDTRKLVRTR